MVCTISDGTVSETLNGRLPPEDVSVGPQTLGKRLSDDLQLPIFQLQKKKSTHKNSGLAMNGVRRSLNAVRRSAFCSDSFFVR